MIEIFHMLAEANCQLLQIIYSNLKVIKFYLIRDTIYKIYDMKYFYLFFWYIGALWYESIYNLMILNKIEICDNIDKKG